MRTRPGRSQSRLCCDYRGGGGLLPSRWKENCDYPAAAIRGAALSERLSEARRLSRAEWSATIVRLSCDYRATIQRLSQSESRAKIFPNFPKTFQKPDQNFFKTVRKSGRFFARQVRGCRGGAVSARGGSAGLKTAGSPPGWARSAAGGDRRAAGLRVWQSGVLLLAGCRCCRAAAAAVLLLAGCQSL